MENIELDQYRKDANVSSHGVEDNSDSDVQQIPGKNYDPSSDKRDMRRLGKTQELKVRRNDWCLSCLVGSILTLLAAPLPLLFHCRLRRCPRTDLGVQLGPGRLLDIQRGHCRRDMVDIRCVLWYGHGDAQSCRDGIDGADVRR